jgi:hypothetical protein
MAEDAAPEWMIAEKVSPKQKPVGRPVPPIPPHLKGASMTKPVDAASAARIESDFSDLIQASSAADEFDIHSRILDCMDENRISPVQANRLLKSLFHLVDGGPGMLRITKEGEVERMEGN